MASDWFEVVLTANQEPCEEILVKQHIAQQWFPNMASDWLDVVLPINQEPY